MDHPWQRTASITRLIQAQERSGSSPHTPSSRAWVWARSSLLRRSNASSGAGCNGRFWLWRTTIRGREPCMSGWATGTGNESPSHGRSRGETARSSSTRPRWPCYANASRSQELQEPGRLDSHSQVACSLPLCTAIERAEGTMDSQGDTRSAAQAMIDLLVDGWGVCHVFGIPGDGINSIVEAL